MARKPSKRRPDESRLDKSEDVVLFCGASADGAGVDVLRKRGSSVQVGVVRPLEEGKPLQGDVVRLVQRGKSPLFDVTVQFTQEQPATDVAAPTEPALEDGRGHPARVASDDYRRNWDAIWKRSPVKALLN